MPRIPSDEFRGTQKPHTQTDDFSHANLRILKERIKDLPDNAPEYKSVLNDRIFALSQAKRMNFVSRKNREGRNDD